MERIWDSKNKRQRHFSDTHPNDASPFFDMDIAELLSYHQKIKLLEAIPSGAFIIRRGDKT
jgi:hypothetical protein